MSPDGRLELELDGAELLDPVVVGPPVVVEGALPDPLLAQPVEVDVGHGHPRPVGEPVALGEQVAALVDHRLAVPRQVGRGLALARGREDVRRAAACGRRPDQQSTVLRPGHGDRAAGQVGEHGRAGQRGLGAGRDRHPHVLADLHVQREVGDVGGPEDEVRPERHPAVAEPDRGPAPVVAGGEVPALVELAVGRQVGLRPTAEDRAAVDDDRAVEDPGAVDERRPHHEDRPQVRRRGDDLGDGGVRGVQQRVLQEQVVDGVAGEAELGEHRHRDAVLVGLPGHRDDRGGVGRGVGDGHRQRARRDPREPVRVRRVEVHVSSLGAGRPEPMSPR